MHPRCGLARAGRIEQVRRFGTDWLLVEMPVGDGFMTELYAPVSIDVVQLVAPERARQAALDILAARTEAEASNPLTDAEIPF